MKIKKLFSLLVVAAMLFTVIAVPVSAADAEGFTIQANPASAKSVKTGQEILIDVVLNGAMASVEMNVTYDATLFDYVTDSFTGLSGFSADTFEDGSFAIRYVDFKTVEDKTVASFKLKACDDTTLDGASSPDAAISGSFIMGDTPQGQRPIIVDENGAVLDSFVINGTTIKVVKKHEAPSITGVKVTVPEEKTLGGIGVEMTAETEGWYDNWNLKEASTFEWKIGDKVESGNKYTPVEADLGKDVVVTATPAVDEKEEGAEAPFTGEPKTATVKVVPAADYVPTATAEIDKITAKKAVEADVVVKMYKGMTDNTTYAWYKVAGVDSEEEAIAAVEAVEPEEGVTVTLIEAEKTATASAEAFVKEDKGNYGVIKVTPVATYNETDYTGEAVYAVAEIKVAGGSAVQGGASLVTGGTTTPSKPVDPEEPGTEEPGTDEPGTEEPAGSEDPAGTANEAGAAAFTDVDKEAYAWAYDSIDVLAKAGVIKGMTADTFGPEITTTNAQVIALVARIAGLTAEEGATTDKVDADHWVAAEMAAADANGILTVYGDGAIDVEGETTREIAFTLLYNALKAAGVELAETAEAIEFTDAASISEGCVEAINALVKAGIVNGMGDGTLAPKATITRAQLAKILGLADALIK